MASAAQRALLDFQTLWSYGVTLRMSQATTDDSFPDILILAGLKKTPLLISAPDALQTRECRVDVVETWSAESFLIAMGWEDKTADKSMEDVFKVERRKE